MCATSHMHAHILTQTHIPQQLPHLISLNHVTKICLLHHQCYRQVYSTSCAIFSFLFKKYIVPGFETSIFLFSLLPVQHNRRYTKWYQYLVRHYFWCRRGTRLLQMSKALTLQTIPNTCKRYLRFEGDSSFQT